MHLTVCCYNVTYKFQSESTLNSLNECQGNSYSKPVPYLNFNPINTTGGGGGQGAGGGGGGYNVLQGYIFVENS